LFDLAAAGLVVLIYDHFLTFSDELELYWQSKASFSKYGFLTNRYVVPAMLITMSVGKHHQVVSVRTLTDQNFPESSGLWDVTFSDAVGTFTFYVRFTLRSYRQSYA
jgi:hypothetical protein